MTMPSWQDAMLDDRHNAFDLELLPCAEQVQYLTSDTRIILMVLDVRIGVA